MMAKMLHQLQSAIKGRTESLIPMGKTRITSMRMSRERPPEEERRPASVNGDEEDLAARPKPKLRRPPEVRKDPASGSNGRCAGVSEQVHGPRVCQRTFFPCY
jgi:hypothetical protein